MTLNPITGGGHRRTDHRRAPRFSFWGVVPFKGGQVIRRIASLSAIPVAKGVNP